MHASRALLNRGNLSFTKYINVTARATRQALKPEKRAEAERRGETDLRAQKWENGKGQDQYWLNKSLHEEK